MWDLWWAKVALGQVFCEYFGFPCQSSPIAPQSTSSVIWSWYNGPIVAAVPSGFSLTPLRIITEIIKKDNLVSYPTDIDESSVNNVAGKRI
jgi:hypothetical protein